jgi:hypothetical protein
MQSKTLDRTGNEGCATPCFVCVTPKYPIQFSWCSRRELFWDHKDEMKGALVTSVQKEHIIVEITVEYGIVQYVKTLIDQRIVVSN